MMSTGMMNGGMGLGMVFNMILWIIFWILIIVGLVYLIKWIVLQTKKGGDMGEDTPLDILKRRYARGEIDREEFEEKKKELL